MFTRPICFALCFSILFAGNLFAGEFHVSPKGDDANPGTEKQPFLTLETARDAGRQMESGEAIIVWLH